MPARKLAETDTQIRVLRRHVLAQCVAITSSMAGDFEALLGEWHTLLRGEPAQARQILRKLITGRLRMVPEIRPDGRFYRWTGQASYGRLLAGLIGVQGMVPPAGNAR